MRQRRAWADGSQAHSPGANRFCLAMKRRGLARPPTHGEDHPARMTNPTDEPQPIRTPVAPPRAQGERYQSGSNEPAAGSETYQSGIDEPTPGSPGYQFGSDEQCSGSAGYPSGSSEPPSSAAVPESLSSDGSDEGVDPYVAYAEIAARERERKKREKEPAIWLPDGDDLDREDRGFADAETRFSRDSWGGRGNPQVSVRLRPRDFERLKRAANLYGVRRTTFARQMIIRGVGAVLDAELRRSGEFLRNS
jgi:hypothetical protein